MFQMIFGALILQDDLMSFFVALAMNDLFIGEYLGLIHPISNQFTYTIVNLN